MDNGVERSRIVLGLLESVERDGGSTQRHRASEYGVALGLVNAYLNYCIKKGFVKVRKIPARRYFYYLTPKGFTEKSRLTISLISNSLSFFRMARADYSSAFKELAGRNMTRIVLVGMSDLAEIATICAAEHGVVLVGIVCPNTDRAQFAGLPIVKRCEDIPGGFNGAVITNITNPQRVYDSTVARLGADCVIAPSILGVACRGSKAAE